MKRVLIIGSQHGNELLGELLYAYIQGQPAHPNLQVSYILANPRAHETGVRYVESDMNRSFKSGLTTYEAQCAERLLAYAQARLFDLVIDAHTTTVNQPPCVITADIGGARAEYMRASHIKHIVVMKHAFLRQSLIGNVPQAVSVEVSDTQLSEELFEALYQDLVAYAAGRARHPDKEVFAVTELLKKSRLAPAEVAALRNFTRSPQGFYSVLVGEAAYEQHGDYLGFVAKTKQEVTV
ncbi:MAG TPA: succinylglutamate desuccinylase/aspartoacylase family protein [Patescibacteria group bacterium]|nr:succinylglutamate desuccinylase/aspartoacylase family protein [Patescibacteria group bacterium]